MKILIGLLIVASAAHPTREFDAYWNAGLAELSRYELTQARYGNLNKGEMIVVTVTEPFRLDKQVKSELTPGQNDTNVLKVQTMRRFATGIYDYTLTTSSFKPLDTQRFPLALKVSGSAVDWCGHAWLQLNLRGNQYNVQGRSYFEEFADEDRSIAAEPSEDEIWQRIRIFGKDLPMGEVSFVPALAALRLRHKRADPLKAFADLRSSKRGDEHEYTLKYAEGRIVAWRFEAAFPYKILRYSETYKDGFQNPRELTTVAYLKKTIRSAYWREHDLQNEKNRREFGVKGFGL